MSVQTIIQSLEKLIGIHEALIETSAEKTVYIREGSIEKLQQLLIKEHKHVQMLEQAEIKRQHHVEVWFKKQQLELDDMTITRMLDIIPNEKEHIRLGNATINLTNLITTLKHQEQLNEALLQQSMQFAQISLDIMSPTLVSMNYGDKDRTQPVQRSVFDSKA